MERRDGIKFCNLFPHIQSIQNRTGYSSQDCPMKYAHSNMEYEHKTVTTTDTKCWNEIGDCDHIIEGYQC